jgi:tripartite-type tricarboxylate transporter receptor subunit TctC
LKYLRTLGAAAVASVVIATYNCLEISLAWADPVADFYTGKQITFIVGSDPGGGYDAQARLVARHIGRFIPGNPVVIVQNMPGAGSVLMSNRIYMTAPKDGTVIGLVQRGVLIAQLTKAPGVQFDITKFNWIGNVAAETALAIAWHTAPVKTVEDLLTHELIVGGTGATSDSEATARLLNAVIGARFKVVSGYAGLADVQLAMERGELQGIADWSWANIKERKKDWVEDKKITLLLQSASQKSPDLPDVPLALDYVKDPADRLVAQLYFAMKSVARPILAAPGVPPDRVAALRQAFLAMAEDAKFRDDAEKSKLEVSPTSYEPIESFVKLATSSPPEIAQRLAEILNPKRS